MSKFETVRVDVGSVVVGSGGQTNDTRRPVEFEGRELGQFAEYGLGQDGGVTDTRGVTQTLYETADGRLIIHINDWSNWQGEPTVTSLHSIEQADLEPGGRFEQLGYEAGYGRPLTLNEALETGG